MYLGGRPLFLAWPFALFACLAVARHLAKWQAGQGWGLVIAVWLTGLVYLSHSRTALVICVALFPLALFVRGDWGGVWRGAVTAAVGAAALGAGIFLYQPMYDRFFGYDASLQVGGVTFNAMGRTAMWNTLLSDIHGSHWFFGKGVGSASRLIDLYFPTLGHPHNDFLRFLYDVGLFGLGLLVLYLLTVFWMLEGAVVKAARRASPDLAIYLTPLLGLLAFVFAMCTDNPVTYVYLTSPLAILLGCALSRMKPVVVIPPASLSSRRRRAPPAQPPCPPPEPWAEQGPGTVRAAAAPSDPSEVAIPAPAAAPGPAQEAL